MPVLEKIRNVTSFRDCRDERISRKVIGTLLEAGRNAPSPAGVHSLEFIVVEGEDAKRKVEMAVDDSRVSESPTAIVVLRDRHRMARRIGKGNAEEAGKAEASTAVQNMRIAAEEFNLSTCWLSGFDGEALSDRLKVPDGKVASDVVLLGYTDHPVEMEDGFGMNEICFYNEYGNQVSTLFDGFEWEGIEEEREIVSRKWKSLKDKIQRIRSSLEES